MSYTAEIVVSSANFQAGALKSLILFKALLLIYSSRMHLSINDYYTPGVDHTPQRSIQKAASTSHTIL